MYTNPEVFATIDQNLFWVLFFAAFAWFFGALQFVEAIRLALRDKVSAMPLGYLFAIIAHDSNAVFFRSTFSAAEHWYFKYTYEMFKIFPFIEIILIAWFVRLSHKEDAPRLSAAAYYAICALFLAVSVALFHLFDSLISDPLNIFGLAYAQIVNIVFVIPWALRRGSTAGQSRLLAWSFLLGPGSIGLLVVPAMVLSLRTPAYYAMVICMTALSFAYVALFEYYRKRERMAATGTAFIQAAAQEN